jgi:hypothetical protein
MWKEAPFQSPSHWQDHASISQVTPYHGNNNPSTLVLILVGLTISAVTATSDPAQTNEQQLWSPSIELTPEYLIAITSGVSITLSLSNLPRHNSLTQLALWGFSLSKICVK